MIPAAYYARASIQPQSDPPQGSGGYGYQWWVTNETGHDSFRAVGLGGQLIQVIPDPDLVLVITSDADQGRDNAADLVGAVIVSALTGQLFPREETGAGTRQVSEPALACGHELGDIAAGAGHGVGEHRRSGRPDRPCPWRAR